jgi:transposase-like protein
MNPYTPKMCFECNSKHITKNGKKKNKVQNFKCADCGIQFVETRGTIFYRKHADAKQTLPVSALLNIKGAISFRSTEQFIELIFSKKRAHTTYFYRHLTLEHNFDAVLAQHKPDYGRIWHIDEVFTKLRRSPGDFGYLFVVTDEKSNLVALYQSEHRDIQSAKIVLHMARMNAGFAPDIIVHDGCPIYERAVTIFGPATKHCQAHFKAEPFLLVKNGKQFLYYLSNNTVEHVNSFIRVWIHHMRGFKSQEKANIWCKMFMCCYNTLKSARLVSLAAALQSC